MGATALKAQPAGLDHEIDFERFERECPANVTKRAEGGTPIYDFRVMIDGEFRAILSKEVYGRGYRLYDADHRPIGRPDGYCKHLGMECEKQADFLTFISDQLPRIPTLEGLADLRAKDAQQAIDDDKQARQNIRDWKATQHGPELLATLKLALPVLEAANGKCTQDTAFIERVRDVIAKAEDVGTPEFFEERVQSEIWSIKRDRS